MCIRDSSKSLLPLPEKFHGLQDRELRYRQRYVDLIVNPDVKRNFVIRSQFIKHVRDFLDGRGYICLLYTSKSRWEF